MKEILLVVSLLVSFSFQSIVQTEYGPVEGISESWGRIFLSIPFAAPPVSDLRWKSPQPAQPWTSPFNTNFRRKCYQPSLPPATDGDIGVNSEDCLYLSVITPTLESNEELLPVMVWIYGGAFAIGSATNIMYNGTTLATTGKVVIVAINYRLGFFGFMAHSGLNNEGSPSGNYGFEDQRFGLEWVQRNIKSFGGDPTRITIFGESAGAQSVLFHMISPLSKGLFHRVIAQSAPPLPLISMEHAVKVRGQRFANKLGCTDSDLKNEVACLRKKTSEEINSYGESFPVIKVNGTFHLNYPEYRMPIVDGKNFFHSNFFLPFESGNFTKVPIILGTTLNESTTFAWRDYPVILDTTTIFHILNDSFNEEVAKKLISLYPGSPFTSLAEMMTHSGFTCPNRRLGHILSQHNIPIRMYEFSWHPSFHKQAALFGVRHAEELPFVFQNQVLGRVFDAQDLFLSEVMSSFWTQFANGKEDLKVVSKERIIEWPFYKPDQYETLHLNEKLNVEKDPHKQKCQIWEELGKTHDGTLLIQPENFSQFHFFLNYYGLRLIVLTTRYPVGVGLFCFIFVGLLFYSCARGGGGSRSGGQRKTKQH